LGLNPDTRYAALSPIECGFQHSTALAQSNVRKLQQPAPHAALQHRAADCKPVQIAGRVVQIEAVVEPKNFIDDVAGGGALRNHFIGEAWKQLLEHLASPGKQAVRVSSLRNAFPGLISVGERIAFHHSHFAVVIGQGTSREQAAHAGADDDCTLVAIIFSHGCTSAMRYRLARRSST